MKRKIITEIIENLKEDFHDNELEVIEKVICDALRDREIIDVVRSQPQSNEEALQAFLAAKSIEGCSKRSISFYQYTIEKMFVNVTKTYYSVTTEDIRLYLSQHRENNNVSKTTIDNIRRIISSFFSWLENEDYIEDTLLLWTQYPEKWGHNFDLMVCVYQDIIFVQKGYDYKQQDIVLFFEDNGLLEVIEKVEEKQ